MKTKRMHEINKLANLLQSMCTRVVAFIFYLLFILFILINNNKNNSPTCMFPLNFWNVKRSFWRQKTLSFWIVFVYIFVEIYPADKKRSCLYVHSLHNTQNENTKREFYHCQSLYKKINLIKRKKINTQYECTMGLFLLIDNIIF